MNNNLKAQFESTEKLYHYTNIDSACKILESMSLRFGSLKELNDPQESRRAIFADLHKDPVLWSNLCKKFRQLSLSRDGVAPGFMIQSMWSHYADKGNGVCLVFDKQKLLEQFRNKSIWNDAVNYIQDYVSDIILASEDDLIHKYNDVFFNKDLSWEPEQEYRIVSYSSEITQVNISDSLMGVILYGSPEEPRYNMADAIVLRKILGDKNKLWELGNFLNEWNLRILDGDTLWTIRPTGEYIPDV